MTAPGTLRPANAEDLREAVADAVRHGRHLEARGGGSKREVGAPERQTTIVDLSALTGVVDYEPSELVLTVRPSTTLAEVEALLASNGQMLAFEPWDHGPLFGRAAGAATIGGVVAAGVAGPRRVSAGGARDHLLGFEAVSGRGEIFRGGGKVVKNVTGYDVSKVIAGSWGQLAIMTELTLKVMPRPRVTATIRIEGLEPGAAIAAMARAMGSPCAVAAAAHLPRNGESPATTAFRLDGFRESVDARARHLADELTEFGSAPIMSEDPAADLWAAIRQGEPIAASEALWRVHHPASRAVPFAAAVERSGGEWFLDWAGATTWVGATAGCDVRDLAQTCGGHAMLLRAPRQVRTATPARQPELPAVAALTARLKRAFDPAGILDPLRFS